MPQNWEEKWDKLAPEYGKWRIDRNIAKAFIKQLRQQDNEELIKNIEKLIQKERFAGAPYALSQVQELINSYYKQ